MMYQAGLILSPLSRAKKKMSDKARRLFFTQLIVIVINVIINALIISLIVSFFGSGYNPIIYWDMLDFFDNFFGTIMYIFVLEIIHLLVRVVFYVFFFLLASSFTNLGNIEPKIVSSAKKAANLMIIGVIADIIGNVVILFDIITPMILYIIGFSCMVWSFILVNQTLRELKQNKLIAIKGNILIPLGSGFKAGGLVTFFVSGFISMTWETFISIMIIFLLCMFVGEVMIVVGIYRLSQYADQIIDPQSYVQLAPVPVYAQPFPPQQPVYQQPQQPQQPQQQVQTPQQTQPVSEEETWFCSNCGMEQKRSAKFCKECGFSLAEQ